VSQIAVEYTGGRQVSPQITTWRTDMWQHVVYQYLEN
jgi:hypothetical protein